MSLRFSLCGNKTGHLGFLHINPPPQQSQQKEDAFYPVVPEKAPGLAQPRSHAYNPINHCVKGMWFAYWLVWVAYLNLEPGGGLRLGDAVHGVAKSRTRLSDFTFHFHALEKEMATHSSVLAWRIPGKGEPGGLPSMGRTESDTTEVK